MAGIGITEAKKINNPSNATKRIDGYVFCTVNGKTDFHSVLNIPLPDGSGKTVGQHLFEQEKQIKNLQKRLDKHRKINKKFLDKINRIEGVLEKYGLE